MTQEQDSVITQEMRDAVGVESDPVSHEVEKGAIIKFAQAIGDDNPCSTTSRPPARAGTAD